MYREGRHKKSGFIPKTKNGCGYRVHTQKGVAKFDENGSFIVRRVRTDDYYAFLTLHLTGGQNEIQVFNGRTTRRGTQLLPGEKDSDYIYFFLEDFFKNLSAY